MLPGAAGLAALKNFLEEGFDAAAFETRSYVGGLWKFSESEDTVSVLTCAQIPQPVGMNLADKT
jgi:cation diffusion facilitator CzcD-associated flavoprotein CzcO